MPNKKSTLFIEGVNLVKSFVAIFSNWLENVCELLTKVLKKVVFWFSELNYNINKYLKIIIKKVTTTK